MRFSAASPRRALLLVLFAALGSLGSLCDTPDARQPTTQVGWATFYSHRRAGSRTASGERYDPRALVAAHPTLAFGTRVRVTRIETGGSIIVRVVDRGPTRAERRRGTVIDLSRAAADSLGFVRHGRTRVRVDVVDRVTKDD